MVGILKKGGLEGGCFRRSRSANSVNISNEVEVIQSTDSPGDFQEPATSNEPLPLLENSVKNSSEAAVEITQESPQKNVVILQRSVSDKGLGSETVPESAANQASESQLPTVNEVSPFPSLPDTILKSMGLLVNGRKVRETLSEDDIENRFTSLSLAFKTDQLTLTTRMELQKRQRDQAESNMAVEVTRLKSAIHKLNRVYVDAESVENLTQIQTLVDILQQATARVSSSAEMFGAVQQEQRLSLATEVLMTHVENVKRSLEKMHVELEEVKRVLADNNIMLEENSDLVDEPTPRTHRYRSLAGIVTANKKVGSKRRASIAAMPRPLGESLKGQAASQVSSLDQKSRMANVVNAIRRKTSLSPASSQSSMGIELRECPEQVSDAMEEIEEVSEGQGVAYTEEKYSPSRPTLEENTSTNDSKCQLSSVENTDKTLVPEIFHAESERRAEELVKAQTEKLPNTCQTILKEVKRRVVEAQLQMTDLYENHRSIILEKLRWTVAAVLVGLAACFLVWIIFPTAEACRERQYSLEELLL